MPRMDECIKCETELSQDRIDFEHVTCEECDDKTFDRWTKDMDNYYEDNEHKYDSQSDWYLRAKPSVKDWIIATLITLWMACAVYILMAGSYPHE